MYRLIHKRNSYYNQSLKARLTIIIRLVMELDRDFSFVSRQNPTKLFYGTVEIVFFYGIMCVCCDPCNIMDKCFSYEEGEALLEFVSKHLETCRYSNT